VYVGGGRTCREGNRKGSNGLTGARRRREALSSPAATSTGSRPGGPSRPKVATRLVLPTTRSPWLEPPICTAHDPRPSSTPCTPCIPSMSLLEAPKKRSECTSSCAR
jgi:hypothetical protein